MFAAAHAQLPFGESISSLPPVLEWHLAEQGVIAYADDKTVAKQIFPHVSVIAIFREIVEDHDVPLCSFSALLVSFIESGSLIDDIFPHLEERVEFDNGEDLLVIFAFLGCRIR